MEQVIRSSAPANSLPQGLPDPLQKRPKGATPHQVAYFAKLVASEQRIAMMPKMPVTVININPYPLMVLNSLFSGLQVPANTDDKPFAYRVIRDVKHVVDTGLDHNHTPVEFWPIQLATEFSQRYAQKGGVFHLMGDLEENPELAKTAEFKKLHAAAENSLIGYCRQLKASADYEWNSPNHQNAKNIHPTHRQAAKILFNRKLLKELPAWMTGDVDVADITPDCPVCMASTKKGQVLCPCSFVLDPFKAFQLGAIEETHAALERLTRAQVEELGVSDFVAETKDEKPARLASRRPKPASVFEAQQQTALETEQAQPAKAKGK